MSKTEERQSTAADIRQRAADIRKKLEGTDRSDPKVPLSLGGNDYTLEYNNTALKAILKATGHNVIRDGLTVEMQDDPEILSVIITEGLRVNHPDITMVEVDRGINYRKIFYIMAQVRLAFDIFMPDVSDLLPPKPEVSAEEPSTKDPS